MEDVDIDRERHDPSGGSGSMGLYRTTKLYDGDVDLYFAGRAKWSGRRLQNASDGDDCRSE